MRKEIFEQPHAVADTLLGRRDADGQLQLDEMRMSDDELRDDRQDHHHRAAARRSTPAWSRSTPSSTGRRIPVEVELAHEFRYRDPILTRTTLVVAISQSGETADTLHGDPARPRAALEGAGDLQHQRLDHPARVRRGDLHPRRPRDRGRLDQGLPHPADRLLPARRSTSPRSAGQHATATRSPRSSTELEAMPAHDRRRVLDGAEEIYALAPTACATPARCCSSAGTRATRWRSRARSSSRSSPTSTPRASPPASSSTARSR